jgi:hypothetical protein
MAGMNIGGRAVVTPPPITATLYAAKGGVETTSDLYTVDPVTGALTSIGAIGFAVTGMSFRPSDGVLFGVASNNSASNPRSLITIDPVTGAGSLVGALGFTGGLADIAFDASDGLFGYRPTNKGLYSVDTSTGAGTQVGATVIPGGGTAGYGISVDSLDDAYVFANGASGVFYLVDLATSGLTAQTALSGSTYSGFTAINSASFDENDLLWVVLSESGPVWHLATIDVGTSTITEVAGVADNVDALVWSLP